MTLNPGLQAHLLSGATTLCRCWRLARRDGRVFTFTDHDAPLSFDGMDFRPGEGVTGSALSQTNGLAVDNAEALGVLTDGGITEADIMAGLYDGAEVLAWAVNWETPSQRQLLFRGKLGEIVRAGGSFRAELRGLAEALNQPQGRVFQTPCAAVLGDLDCGVTLETAAFRWTGAVEGVGEARRLRLPTLSQFAPRWFERGVCTVLDGASAGAVRTVKFDRAGGSGRWIELDERLSAGIDAGDRVKVVAGCDKRAETCRAKFANMANFRGFPHLPGEDWLMAYPVAGEADPEGRVTGVRS